MLAELENISYYVQAPGHNKRFSGHGSEKSNKRDTTDRAKRGVWDEKRGKERKKKKISIVFCT